MDANPTAAADRAGARINELLDLAMAAALAQGIPASSMWIEDEAGRIETRLMSGPDGMRSDPDLRVAIARIWLDGLELRYEGIELEGAKARGMPEWARQQLAEVQQDDWRTVGQHVLTEALEMYGSGRLIEDETDANLKALAARVRGHFLDRWYRFAPWGVKSRRDLEPLAVEAELLRREVDGQMTVARSVKVSYAGTPLRS